MKDKNAKKRPRLSTRLDDEAKHYLRLEQEARQGLGMHNATQVAIVNDWMIAMGRYKGYPPPDAQNPKPALRYLHGAGASVTTNFDQLTTLARMPR